MAVNKTQAYPVEGVLALLTRYIEAYRQDVAQALRTGHDSPDYDQLVSGARRQHYDPFIEVIARATGQTPEKLYEAMILTSWIAAEQSSKTQRTYQAANFIKSKTISTLKGKH